ncbi:aminoglycoside phosphotransferase family protein [Shinella sp. 838]|uniref:phosphotransferase family protein n=1 Tax=Shinella sp. 838 TaxID=3038164 RepID=UPI0024150EE7|nr:aminoglycoside phosphotransferase family protein [Shinella sp. 838]MDG4674841.1 aminoglycoside phosphotransferase family protein [Shinella sp. 838]
MISEFERHCQALLLDLGLISPSEVVAVRRLTGGVASDIAAVTFGERTICAKFALAKLKVRADWFAPLHRGRAEYAWLKFAGTVVPGSAPALYGWSDTENGFAMEFIDGSDVYLWKAALLQGKSVAGEAVSVADTLGRIHAASTAPDFDRSPFANAKDFDALRLEPYLRFTAEQYPSLAKNLIALADQQKSAGIALVHGDVSPKNILWRNQQPIILDAECATMGDPVFDVAFCMNHLLLKSCHVPEIRGPLRQAVLDMWRAYKGWIRWESAGAFEERLAALLPPLMLARVDGKSPVEYLALSEQADVRGQAVPLIEQPPATLSELLNRLQ